MILAVYKSLHQWSISYRFWKLYTYWNDMWGFAGFHKNHMFTSCPQERPKASFQWCYHRRSWKYIVFDRKIARDTRFRVLRSYYKCRTGKVLPYFFFLRKIIHLMKFFISFSRWNCILFPAYTIIYGDKSVSVSDCSRCARYIICKP